MAAASIHNRDTPTGLAYGLAAYIWWGAMPLYIRQLDGVSAGEILGFRIVTSLVVLGAILLVMHRMPQVVTAIRTRSTRIALTTSAVLVGVNWFVYTKAINDKKTVEASLGYFLQPLLNALFGAVLFREGFRRGQLIALAVAALGMLELLFVMGELPWNAVTLAISFGLYSVVRKATPVDGLVGLSVEIIILFPIALVYLFWLGNHGQLFFGSHWSATDAWLLASGIATSIPMICFGFAARRLRLSTLGFVQYLSPTIQFLLAVVVFKEEVHGWQLAGYSLVWLALIIYSIDSFVAARIPRSITHTIGEPGA